VDGYAETNEVRVEGDAHRVEVLEDDLGGLANRRRCVSSRS